MWDSLLGSIRQIGVFMICAQALIYFKPKGSYEKYLKLLVSAMILVQLLSPVQALLADNGGPSLEERIAFYSSSFEQGLGEAALEEYRMEQIRQQLLTSQINNQMDMQEETNEIRIHVEPVTVEIGQSGLADREQEAEHIGEGQGEDREEDGGEGGEEDSGEDGSEDRGEDKCEDK